ncbi:MAG: hypothetical protein ABL309_01785 [Phycisphaerales bacterium]
MKRKPLSGNLVPSDLVLRAGGGKGDGRRQPPAPVRPRTPASPGRWTLTIRVVDSCEGKAKVPISLIASLIARAIEAETCSGGGSPGDRGTGGGATASGLPDAQGGSAAASEGSEGGASD